MVVMGDHQEQLTAGTRAAILLAFLPVSAIRWRWCHRR